MATTPVPLEEVAEDRAAPLLPELQSAPAEMIVALPADTEACEGTVSESAKALAENGAALQLADAADAAAQAIGEPQPPNAAPDDEIPAASLADRVEDAGPYPPSTSLVPLVEVRQDADTLVPALPDTLSHRPMPPALEVAVSLTVPTQLAATQGPPSSVDDATQVELADASLQGDAGWSTTPLVPTEPPPAEGQPIAHALDAAMKLAADANAAAEALENLKRLLERGAVAGTTALAVADAQTTPPALPLVPVHQVDLPTRETKLQLPLTASQPRGPSRERRRLDVHGFLAGFAMSLAVGALLYLLLTAG